MNISQEDFGTLCICALRYCHGRKTYMPSLVQEIVGRHLEEFSDKTIKIMVDDCQFQRDMNLYGDECDKVDWLRWEQKVKDEQTRRTIEKREVEEMTREEAIKIIEVVFKSKEAYKHNDSVTHQALNMAREALSAEYEDYEHATLVDIKEPLKVAVVRCKDCKHRDEKCGMGERRWCRILKMSTVPNDFCSYGKRKGGDTE